MKEDIVIICGPTCSGKTKLAVEVAEKLDSCVISADSMCVYKGFDIGTAKPTEEEKREIPHYLLDVADPFCEFSIADYKNMAEPIIAKYNSEDKIPVICGGTGFYINSLIYDLSYGKGGKDDFLRTELNAKTKEELFEDLLKKDPESAKNISANDKKRIVRALEIFYSTGIKKSDIKDEFKLKRNYKAFYINYPREELYRRINSRVDEMLKKGLIQEVETLKSLGLTEKNNAMQGIGYKEIYAYLCGETTLEEAVELIKINTRHYAKRQLTFFKKLSGLTPLSPEKGYEKMLQDILDNLELSI